MYGAGGEWHWNAATRLQEEECRIDTLLLIDGGLIFRAFFAMPPMSDTAGRPVGAVYGFMTMAFRELAAIRPTHVAVAFDVPIADNRRTHIFADYKGNRDECPPELSPQFGILRETLDSLNITCLRAPGYEADDLIGTMAAAGERSGMEVSVLTGDRDVFQLISGKTQVRFVKKMNQHETYDVPRFVQEFELLPGQLADLKGLAGDASDNIPGIAGIGPKTAVKLLHEFETVEGVLANAHTQKGKLRERLENGREIALLCKQLATINRAVPDVPDLQACRFDLNRDAGRVKFEELRFRSLLGRLAV
ncbi:MAG TPA: 5'-3' exonuclease H3TH domain-containing protein [Symbiobacteriaceae bacterium]|nr:5'-3' exonuclease H3TH domain-containing protein [Symbiobacteriaceae bacterium]